MTCVSSQLNQTYFLRMCSIVRYHKRDTVIVVAPQSPTNELLPVHRLIDCPWLFGCPCICDVSQKHFHHTNVCTFVIILSNLCVCSSTVMQQKGNRRANMQGVIREPFRHAKCAKIRQLLWILPYLRSPSLALAPTGGWGGGVRISKYFRPWFQVSK